MMNDDQKRTEENKDLYSVFDNPVHSEDKAPKKRRINSRTRTLIIALIMVAVLAGVLLLIPLLPEEPADSSSTDSSDATTYTLLEKGKNAPKNEIVVRDIAIDSQRGDYRIQYDKEQDLYLLVGYEDLELDPSSVETLTDCATTFSAQDKLSAPGDLKDYGLDKPAASATIVYYDDSTATIKIGDLTPDESGFYVTVDDKDIYIANESMVSPFLLSNAEYVEATLLTTPTIKKDDEDGNAVLKELELTGSVYEKPLTIRRISPSDTKEFTYFTYVITSPYYRGVSETAAAELGKFTTLEAAQAVILHPTQKQLNEFGFDKPGVVANITVAVETTGEAKNEDADPPTIYYNSTTITVTIGSTDENGHYFVMVDGTDAIFYVASNQFSAVAERRYENTVSDQLFLKDITTLSAAKLTYEGKTYHYQFTHHEEKDEKDEKLIVMVDGKTYPTADFRLLYQLAMSIERYGETDDQPTGEPTLSMNLYLENGESFLQVDFFPISGSLHTARTSEGELFTVKSSEVHDFIKQATNYLNGEQVLVNY